MNPAVLSSRSNLVITFLASFLIWAMFFGLFLLWFWNDKIKKEQVVHAFFSSVLAWVISSMIKELLPALRPFETNGSLPLTLTIPLDSSFPSTHAATAFALAASVYLHDKKIGLCFFGAAIGVGLGRILSNVHFAGDVLGGIVVGVIIAYLLEGLHLFGLVKKAKT